MIKKSKDVVAEFEKIARNGKSISIIDSNKDHNDILEERWKRANKK